MNKDQDLLRSPSYFLDTQATVAYSDLIDPADHGKCYMVSSKEPETKKAYRVKMEDQLDEYRERLTLLRARAFRIDAESRAEYNRRIKELAEELKDTRERLRKVVSARDEVWDDLKTDLDNIWRDLKSACDKISKKF